MKNFIIGKEAFYKYLLFIFLVLIIFHKPVRYSILPNVSFLFPLLAIFLFTYYIVSLQLKENLFRFILRMTRIELLLFGFVSLHILQLWIKYLLGFISFSEYLFVAMQNILIILVYLMYKHIFTLVSREKFYKFFMWLGLILAFDYIVATLLVKLFHIPPLELYFWVKNQIIWGGDLGHFDRYQLITSRFQSLPGIFGSFPYTHSQALIIGISFILATYYRISKSFSVFLMIGLILSLSKSVLLALILSYAVFKLRIKYIVYLGVLSFVIFVAMYQNIMTTYEFYSRSQVADATFYPFNELAYYFSLQPAYWLVGTPMNDMGEAMREGLATEWHIFPAVLYPNGIIYTVTFFLLAFIVLFTRHRKFSAIVYNEQKMLKQIIAFILLSSVHYPIGFSMLLIVIYLPFIIFLIANRVTCENLYRNVVYGKK